MADAPLWFFPLLLALAIAAGATASVVGFGIGSLLTPLLAARYGTDAAIAMVALPHLAGGALRGWRLRAHVNRHVLVRFGLLSAACGLVGALLFARLAPDVLARVLGGLLILTAIAGLSGWAERWKPRGVVVWALAALSGFFGGMVGNQGGLRAGALTTFGLGPTAFVATSTIIGIMIDLVRTPVYLSGDALRAPGFWTFVAVAAAGVIVGTLLGERLLLGLSPVRFRVLVSCAIGVLGLWFLLGPA